MAKPEETDKLRAEWFWCDRWANSSAKALPIAHRGLYREMLTAAWSLGARLPANHADIRRLVGVETKEWKLLWPRVEPYWRLDGEFLVNDTQLEVYAEAVRQRSAATKRGKAGADARWNREQGARSAGADAQALPTQSTLSPSQIPSTPSGSQAAPSQAPQRKHHPDPQQFRIDPNAAYQGAIDGRPFSIPEGWAKRARNDYRLTFEDIDAFGKWLCAQVEAEGGIIDDKGRRFPWLDMRLAAWRERRTVTVSSATAISATQAMLDNLRERSLAAIEGRTRG